VTGDAKYGTAENVRAIESAGIRAYVAPHESGGKGKAFFSKGEFVYDPKRDLYLCPAGKELHRVGKSGEGITYRANISACQNCPLKERCTPSEGARNINRYPSEEYMERVRAYQHTEPYKKAMRKRKVWIEPLFDEAKDWHWMRRFCLRRLKKVNIEALLVASGQNIKRLLAARGRGPRSMAQEAAALHLPKPTHFTRVGPSSRDCRPYRRRNRLWAAQERPKKQERPKSFSTGCAPFWYWCPENLPSPTAPVRFCFETNLSTKVPPFVVHLGGIYSAKISRGK
jgi:hypothetical protein